MVSNSKLQIIQYVSKQYRKPLTIDAELKLQVMQNIAKKYNKDLLYKDEDKDKGGRFRAWDYVVNVEPFIIFADTGWNTSIYIEYTDGKTNILFNEVSISINNILLGGVKLDYSKLDFSMCNKIISNRAQQQMTIRTIDYLLSLEKGRV